MKSVAVIGGKLAIICAAAAIILGVVNSITEPLIIQNKETAKLEALKAVAGGNEVGQAISVDDTWVESYYPLDGGKNGFVCLLKGTGYGGDLRIMAAFSVNGEVLAALLTDNSETPGLGKAAEDPRYMQKYVGKGDKSPVPVSKELLTQNDADSITGATITFAGIGKSLAAGSSFVKSLGAR